MMRSSIAEELQSISVTSFRLLPLAMPALPGRRGQDAVSTLTPLPQLISSLGFRNPLPRESYETENHSRAEPRNSTSGGLAAPSSSTQSCLPGPKTSLQSIAPVHSDQQQGESKNPAGSRGRARAEGRFSSEHPRDGGCCFSFFSQPPRARSCCRWEPALPFA